MFRTSFLLSLLAAMLASDDATSSRTKASQATTIASADVPNEAPSEKERIIADARHCVFSELSNL